MKIIQIPPNKVGKILNDLSGAEIKILIYLYSIEDRGVCSATIKDICVGCKLTRKTALKHIRSLENLGYVKRDRSVFWLLVPETQAA